MSFTILMLVGLSFVLFGDNGRSPIDPYAKSLDFQIYFPEKLPSNLKFVDGSVQISEDLIFFKFADGMGEIIVSQQPRPESLESFRVDGFDSVATNVGSMLVGKTEDRPTAFITTDKTLITISGYSNQDRLTITTIGQNLQRVQ